MHLFQLLKAEFTKVTIFRIPKMAIIESLERLDLPKLISQKICEIL